VVCGPVIEASVDGVRLKARDESPLALADGGVGLIVQGGACSCDVVLVAPPLGAPDELGKARSADVAA
jgi:hypothetical protein